MAFKYSETVIVLNNLSFTSPECNSEGIFSGHHFILTHVQILRKNKTNPFSIYNSMPEFQSSRMNGVVIIVKTHIHTIIQLIIKIINVFRVEYH